MALIRIDSPLSSENRKAMQQIKNVLAVHTATL
jgi:hypothetical protein